MATWRRVWLVAVVGVLALAGASCGGKADRSSPDAGGTEGAASADGGRAATTAVDEQQIIATVDMVVRVDDVQDAIAAAGQAARARDGRVAGQEIDLAGDPTATLTIRVPGDRLDALLADLGDLGHLVDQDLDSQEVTAQVVDLRGRLETQQASADRLRELMAEAKGTADIVALEHELASRESEIESLQGQLRVLDDQTSEATITVRLTEADGAGDRGLPSFVDSLRRGAGTLGDLGLLGLAVAGFALPFLPFIVATWFAARWWRRRHPPQPPSPHGPWLPAAPVPPPPPVPTSSPGSAGPVGVGGPPPGERRPAPAAGRHRDRGRGPSLTR